MKKRYLGIDFGNEGVSVALISSFLGRRKVEGVGFSPYIYVEGMSQDDIVLEALRKALEVGGRNGSKGAKVIVSIPLSEVFIREIKLPKASRSQQRRILELGEIERYVPTEANDLSFSFYPVRDLGKGEISALLLAARRRVVDRYVGYVRALGLDPDIVTSKALGIVEWYNSLNKDSSDPVIVLEPDGEIMEMVVIRRNSVLLKRTISMEDEEALKRELNISFGYLERDGLSPKEVYILGPDKGSLEEFISKALGLPVLKPKGWAIQKKADEDGFRWTGTLGIAMLGFKPASKVANLLERTRDGRKGRIVAIFLVGLYLAANLWGYLELNGRIEAKRRMLSELTKEYKSLEPTFIALSSSNPQGIGQRIGTVRYGAAWLRILLELSKLAPRGIWLTDISMEWEKGVSIRGRALDEPSLTSFLEALGNSDIIKDVELKFAGQGITEGKQVVDFQITFVPKGMEKKVAGTSTRRSLEQGVER